MTGMSNSDTNASSDSLSLKALKGEAIAIQGVSKRFGAIIGVDRVDLRVEAGQFVTLS